MAKKLNTNARPTKADKAKAKSKKPTVEPVEKPTESKCFCQYCKAHKNNPSTCKDTGKYVGRKNPGCANFR